MLVIDDGRGRRLHLVWSKSGKRLIATVTTPSSGHSQCLLDRDQVDALRVFLADVGGEIAFEDPDEPDRSLTLTWNRRVNRLVAQAGPASVELQPYDLHELAVFLTG